MTGLRKWAAIAGVAAIAVTATMMSAYAGAQQGAATPAPAGKKETATEAANREASGKAVPGPWAYSGASGYTHYLGQGTGRSPVQPIKFPHPVHVNTLKINCVYLSLRGVQVARSGSPGRRHLHGLPYGHRARPPRDPEAPEVRGRQAAGAVGARAQGSRVRALPAHAPRECRRHLPDVPRADQQHAAGLPVRLAEHGLVRQLPRAGILAGRGNKAAGYVPDSATIAMPRKKASYDCSNCHY